MRDYFQILCSEVSGKLNQLSYTKNGDYSHNPIRRIVKYQFHLPGANNFHLLPFKNRFQGPLNIFKPYWNRSGFMQSNTSKSLR